MDVAGILKETGALLEGHFLLSSGLHSGGYVQCAKLLRFPDKAAQVLGVVVDQVKDLDFDLVCGPAIGGIIVSYEMGRQLGKESIFTERVDNQMVLRRGFEVPKGSKVLITEDILTTGKSSYECIDAILGFGCEVVGIACIADRREAGTELSLPVYSALKLEIKNYSPEACLLCSEGKIELEKPGSRKQSI
ncbi:MAG: orotate phosphoribosyltransferase [Eubacteriaceae bacterium]|nr:orotate phosphoribosyltransferase [Eubacteriaceae bacterium]